MSISPFSARPAPSEGDGRRARLAIIIATVGIAATLLAYAISPGVRHAVSHAAHSVKHAVGNALDHDTLKRGAHRPARTTAPPAHPKQRAAKGAQPTGGSQAPGGSTGRSPSTTGAP
jgi:hypothetical protein